jgi:hypothetical protein
VAVPSAIGLASFFFFFFFKKTPKGCIFEDDFDCFLNWNPPPIFDIDVSDKHVVEVGSLSYDQGACENRIVIWEVKQFAQSFFKLHLNCMTKYVKIIVSSKDGLEMHANPVLIEKKKKVILP